MGTVFGAVATAISLASFVPYIRDVISGKTRPHVFSWLVWTSTVAIAAGAQIIGGAGAGAWVSVASTVPAAVVLVLAIRQGGNDRTLLDWLSLVGCGAAAIGWVITSRPVVAVVMICIVNVLAYIPTLRKSWRRPHEETLSVYSIAIIKHCFTLLAINTFSLTTALYPVVLLALSLVTTIELVSRRRLLSI